ncbi:hypothetical protein ACFL3S_06795 [Gemmatimonadota bacterium]
MPEAGRRLSRAERLTRFLAQRAVKLASDPGVIWRKLRRRQPDPCQLDMGPPVGGEPVATLDLQPGEWVRVKSLEEIRATLDSEERYDRLGFFTGVQERFCGQTFQVKKRVDRFFDERRYRMLKVRDVVLLDSVLCEPPADATNDWAGCQRSCFLFWKEAWLERVPGPDAVEVGEDE